MKTLILIIISVLTFQSAYSQNADNLPPDHRPYRATEGSGPLVTIDTITPLPQLVHRLTNDWEFIMTGKAYWIGYTDNMYSIAAYK